MKPDGYYEYLTYNRENNGLYAISYTEVMKLTDEGCEKAEASVDNAELKQQAWLILCKYL